MSSIPADVLERCLAAIDAAHAADPEQIDGRAAELLYADRVEAWMPQLVDEMTDLARLAGRCQHLERWSIPRDSYPMDRPSYLKWRRDLAARQGDRAKQLTLEAGLHDELAERLRTLAAKRAPKSDPIAQAMEDAACLVFLEHHAADFAPGQGHDKMIPIIQKTWAKMSDRGHALALQLNMNPAVLALVQEALS